MGFRPDLDLSAILGLHERMLPSAEEAEAMRKSQDQDDSLRYETPVRLGWGPDRWSTSMALVPVVHVCHDVNGYYRELGVDWRATRKELMQAYMAKDGQSSVRLTYVFKQLLDPLIREAYDKSPKGEPFLDDYTQDDLKKRAHMEASRRSGLGEVVSAEDVLGEMGYVTLDEEEGVDTVRATRQDLSQRKAGRGWRYSYYAWQTREFVQDESRLQEWQDLLSKSSVERMGSSAEVAIGVTSMLGLSDRPFIIETVGNKPVIFFSTEAEPTSDVATQALTEFLTSSHPSQFPSQQGDNS